MKNDDSYKDRLTISQFAECVDQTARTLRLYDNDGVFSPAEYGAENDYRFYETTQITAFKMISTLIEIEVPLDTIKGLRMERSPEKMIKLFHEYKEKIAANIRSLERAYSVINTRIGLLYEAISVDETKISVSFMPKTSLVMGDVNNFNGGSEFYAELLRFYNAPHKQGLNKSFPVGGYWDSMTAFLSEPSLPMRFFSLDPRGDWTSEEGLYLNGYTRGNYGRTNGLPKQMEEYAKENGLRFTGPVFNTYLTDEVSETNPEHYLLQVSASVSETQRTALLRPRRPHRLKRRRPE